MKIFGYELTREAKPDVGDARGSRGAVENRGSNWLLNVMGSSQPEVALKQAAVYYCADIIASSIATMTLRYMRQAKMPVTKQTYYKVFDNDVDGMNYLLNVRPNAWMNGYEMKYQMVLQYLLHGNAVILPVDVFGKAISQFGAQKIDHLVLLSPGSFSLADRVNNLYSVCDAEQGVPYQTVEGSQLFHIMNTNGGETCGRWGQSTIHYALRGIQQGQTADSEMLKRVATGGRGKYILGYESADKGTFGTNKRSQMDSAAMKLEDDWAQKDIITLPDRGLNLHPISMNSNDLQLLQIAHISKADIALWFHVPQYMLGEQTSNYKTPDAATTMFIQQALTPITKQIECEMMAKYVGRDGYQKRRFDFDETSLIQLDLSARAAWNKSRLETGLATVNELRREEYLEPIDGGDELMLSANLKTMKVFEAEGAGAGSATNGEGSATKSQNTEGGDAAGAGGDAAGAGGEAAAEGGGGDNE